MHDTVVRDISTVKEVRAADGKKCQVFDQLVLFFLYHSYQKVKKKNNIDLCKKKLKPEKVKKKKNMYKI